MAKTRSKETIKAGWKPAAETADTVAADLEALVAAEVLEVE